MGAWNAKVSHQGRFDSYSLQYLGLFLLIRNNHLLTYDENAGSFDFNLIQILYFICFVIAMICRFIFTSNSPNDVHVPSIEYDEVNGYVFTED